LTKQILVDRLLPSGAIGTRRRISSVTGFSLVTNGAAGARAGIIGGLQAAVAAMSTFCPCGSGRSYALCCAPLIAGVLPAPSAEALMRSRYTAYTLGCEAYLLATWHESRRPAALDLASETGTRWLGLQVKRHTVIDADHATVDFVARYKIAGRAHRLCESSRFVREDGRWTYLDGEVDTPPAGG
jgi:SEC-C motif-containing protein